MSVQTTYDDMRDELKATLEKALKQAKELVIREDVWGFDEMKENYAMDVYKAVRDALASV